MLSVILNSFVHRVPDKSHVLALAHQTGCQLKRIRRSRNWLLSGQEDQLRLLSGLLNQAPHLWIVKAIDTALPQPVVNLQALIAETPTLTVNQLVKQTGCSLSEARQALDEFEDF